METAFGLLKASKVKWVKVARLARPVERDGQAWRELKCVTT